jgi:hypothetical protein
MRDRVEVEENAPVARARDVAGRKVESHDRGYVFVRDEGRAARVWVGRSPCHEREGEGSHDANGGASEVASDLSPIHHELISWRTNLRIDVSKGRSVKRRRSKKSRPAHPLQRRIVFIGAT